MLEWGLGKRWGKQATVARFCANPLLRGRDWRNPGGVWWRARAVSFLGFIVIIRRAAQRPGRPAALCPNSERRWPMCPLKHKSLEISGIVVSLYPAKKSVGWSGGGCDWPGRLVQSPAVQTRQGKKRGALIVESDQNETARASSEYFSKHLAVQAVCALHWPFC